MGLTLDTYGFAGDGRFHTIDGKSVDWSTVCENALGIALSLWDIREESWLLERAAVSGIPTAVWNERPRGGTLLTASNLRYFQTAYSSDSGRKLARIALSAGRSRIAWISPFQGATWAERRLEGIRDALDGRGALVCKATEPLLSVYREPEVESSDFWFDASRMRTHLGASLEPGIDEIVRKLGLLLARRTLCQRLSGLFEQALRSDADAWILANDEVAHLAWDWLQRKGKEVPGDISLAGFDDIHTSRERGLTSIHFDEGRLASACLRHLTGPREGARDEIVQIPCLAMVRRSMVA
ncbi:MAG TPA: substrate-binding domain-containing protein [Fibrobacteria bacterium]|nr:substrate-binding domain-containing protein [Fibrobacteria bacterium]